MFVSPGSGRHAVSQTPADPARLWLAERGGVAVCGVGMAELLQGPLVAFFASRQCPGMAIRMGTEWALQQARKGVVLVGGFHSPLEQSALRLVLEAGGSAVVVLARPVASASLHSAWRDALTAGKMAVVSASATTHRLTAQAAGDRNELAARLADRIVIAHASPGGQLSRQAEGWRIEGLLVESIGPASEAA